MRLPVAPSFTGAYHLSVLQYCDPTSTVASGFCDIDTVTTLNEHNASMPTSMILCMLVGQHILLVGAAQTHGSYGRVRGAAEGSVGDFVVVKLHTESQARQCAPTSRGVTSVTYASRRVGHAIAITGPRWTGDILVQFCVYYFKLVAGFIARMHQDNKSHSMIHKAI